LAGSLPDRRRRKTLPCDPHPLNASPSGGRKTPVLGTGRGLCQQNFSENIHTLRKGGAHVEEVELPEIFGLAHRAIRTIMAAEAALNLEELYLKHAPMISPTLKDFIAEGRDVGALVYLQALKLRLALKEELERFLERYDASLPSHDGGGAGDAGAYG